MTGLLRCNYCILFFFLLFIHELLRLFFNTVVSVLCSAEHQWRILYFKHRKLTWKAQITIIYLHCKKFTLKTQELSWEIMGKLIVKIFSKSVSFENIRNFYRKLDLHPVVINFGQECFRIEKQNFTRNYFGQPTDFIPQERSWIFIFFFFFNVVYSLYKISETPSLVQNEKAKACFRGFSAVNICNAAVLFSWGSRSLEIASINT